MATGQNTQTPTQAEIVAFEPFLQRRRDREQFFQRYGTWTDTYRAGVDGLWIEQRNAQVVSLVP